jgi:hypothetical protein
MALDLEQAKSYLLSNWANQKDDIKAATALIVPESDGSPFFVISKQSGNISYGKHISDYRTIKDERLIEIVALVQ